MLDRATRQCIVLVLVLAGVLVVCGAHTEASQVIIEGNEALAQWKGVTGKGTAEAPYVLEGLQVPEPGGSIQLINVDAHTVIRGGEFSGGGPAIGLSDCSNITVLECTFEGNDIALTAVGCSNITVSLCSFANNGHDLGLAEDERSVRLDDGYIGNWWESYEGADTTGDGIGDEPHALRDYVDVFDRHPLIYPYVGTRSGDPAGLRLEIRETDGDEIEWYASRMTSATTHTVAESGMQGPAEPSTTYSCWTTTANAMVIPSPGAGSFALQTEFLEHSMSQTWQTGHIQLSGTARPAGSSRVIHRFGHTDSTLPPLEEEAVARSEPVPIDPMGTGSIPFPIRPIEVGHRWSTHFEVADATYGAGAVVDVVENTAHTLVQVSSMGGAWVAVILSVRDFSMNAAVPQSDGDLVMEVQARSTTTTVSWIDTESGHTIRSSSIEEASEETWLDCVLITSVQEHTTTLMETDGS